MRVIHDETVFLSIADIHVAVVGIHGDAVDHAEVALPRMIAEPLIDELAVLVEMQDPRGADAVRRRLVDVVRALVRMTFADIDIAVRREREMQRLPEQPLSLRLVPIASLPADADRHQQFPLRAQLHHRVAVLVADPDVVLGVDRHAVRFVLVTDDVFADGAHELVALVELEQLRLAGGVALKREQMSLRIDRDRRDAATAFRQSERVRELEAEIGRADFVGNGVALAAPCAQRANPCTAPRRRLPGRLRLADRRLAPRPAEAPAPSSRARRGSCQG